MMNRRTFLVASGLTALASTRAFGANGTLRIGVIGAGHRAKGLLDAADKAAPYQLAAGATCTHRTATPFGNAPMAWRRPIWTIGKSCNLSETACFRQLPD